MLNIFGAIGSMLPGYVEGQRNAVEDNWQDLENYNDVQAGQFANAWTEANWDNNLNMMYDAARNSRLGYAQNAANFAIFHSMYPYMYDAAIEQARAMPGLQALDNKAKFGMYGNMFNNPNMLAAAIANGWFNGGGGFGGVNNPPSAMR